MVEKAPDTATIEAEIARLASASAAELRWQVTDRTVGDLCELGRQWLRANRQRQQRRSLTLSRDRHHHSGLLWLPAGEATPIHDHAGSHALTLLLAGQARIERFFLQERRGNSVTIRHEQSFEPAIGAGVWTLGGGAEPSLHRLTGLTNGALLLGLHFPPVDPRLRLLVFLDDDDASDIRRGHVVTEWALNNATRKAGKASGVT